MAHMLGICGEEQFTGKTMGVSPGEKRATGSFIKSSAPSYTDT